MAIIVTGASGQFGRAAVKGLLAKGVAANSIIATTRSTEKLADLASAGVQVRRADFNDPGSLESAFAGGTKMLLISTDAVGGRIEQHRRAITAASKAGVRHIIYTSLLAADDPNNPALVKVEHRATEELILQSGLGWNFLRDSQYAEAVGIGMAPFALRTGLHRTASGHGRVAFVSRWDCVDCAVGLLTGAGQPNHAYTLTGSEAFSQAEAIALVSRLTGKALRTEIVSIEVMQDIFDNMGVARTFADMTPETTMPWVSEDMLSFDLAIKAGVFDKVTGDVQLLSGHKPRTLESVLKQQLPEILASLGT